MTDDEALAAIGHLVAMTNGWDEDSITEYVDQLVALDSPDALKAACISIGRAWDQLARPPLKVIIESYDREVRLSGPPAIDPVRIHCEGSGWRPRADGRFEPCPRCNPWLWDVWQHPDKWIRFLDCEGLEALEVGIERVSGRLRDRDGRRAPHCTRVDDPDDPVCTIERGLTLAWTNYAAQAKEDGRKVNRRHFDEMTGRSR